MNVGYTCCIYMYICMYALSLLVICIIVIFQPGDSICNADVLIGSLGCINDPLKFAFQIGYSNPIIIIVYINYYFL